MSWEFITLQSVFGFLINPAITSSERIYKLVYLSSAWHMRLFWWHFIKHSDQTIRGTPTCILYCH